MDFAFVVFILVNGLASGGLAAIVRALPWDRFRLTKRWKHVKPLGCPLCMGWWCALFVQYVAHVERVPGVAPLGTWVHGLQLLAVVAVAAWLNAQIIPPAFEMPEVEASATPKSCECTTACSVVLVGDAGTPKTLAACPQCGGVLAESQLNYTASEAFVRVFITPAKVATAPDALEVAASVEVTPEQYEEIAVIPARWIGKDVAQDLGIVIRDSDTSITEPRLYIVRRGADVLLLNAQGYADILRRPS